MELESGRFNIMMENFKTFQYASPFNFSHLFISFDEKLDWALGFFIFISSFWSAHSTMEQFW